MQYVFYGIGIGLFAIISLIVWLNENYTDKDSN
jgi:hypothetical protein